MIIDVHITKYMKNPKKTCFQNGNTICEHKFHFLQYSLTGIHQVFSIWALKKKEQKRARVIFRDFYKRKKILQITFFQEKNAYFEKK